MIVGKPFSKSLHAKYDILGKLVVISSLSQNNRKCKILSDRRNPYTADLLVTNLDNGKEYYYDPEVKMFWEDYDVPSYIENNGFDLPFRKKKFLELDKPIYFSIVSCSLSRFAVIKGSSLKGAELNKENEFGICVIAKSNKYSSGEELFFRIPVKQCTLISVPEVSLGLLEDIRVNLFACLERANIQSIQQEISNIANTVSDFNVGLKNILQFLKLQSSTHAD